MLRHKDIEMVLRVSHNDEFALFQICLEVECSIVLDVKGKSPRGYGVESARKRQKMVSER